MSIFDEVGVWRRCLDFMAASEMDLISAESCPGYTSLDGVTYCSGVSNKQNLLSHIAINRSVRNILNSHKLIKL